MLTALLDELAAQLAGVGVKASHDPDKLPAALPAALLYPAALDFDRLDAGTATVEVDVILVTRGRGTTPALDDLETMLTACRTLWPVNTVTAVNVLLRSHSPDPLPGFRFTLTSEVTST